MQNATLYELEQISDQFISLTTETFLSVVIAGHNSIIQCCCNAWTFHTNESRSINYCILINELTKLLFSIEIHGNTRKSFRKQKSRTLPLNNELGMGKKGHFSDIHMLTERNATIL